MGIGSGFHHFNSKKLWNYLGGLTIKVTNVDFASTTERRWGLTEQHACRVDVILFLMQNSPVHVLEERSSIHVGRNGPEMGGLSKFFWAKFSPCRGQVLFIRDIYELCHLPLTVAQLSSQTLGDRNPFSNGSSLLCLVGETQSFSFVNPLNVGHDLPSFLPSISHIYKYLRGQPAIFVWAFRGYGLSLPTTLVVYLCFSYISHLRWWMMPSDRHVHGMGDSLARFCHHL